MALRSFSKGELVLNNEDALKVFAFFFEDTHGITSKEITDQDRAFAQALMVEAIQSSQAFGVTEILFKLFGTGTASKFSIVKGITEFMIKKGKSLWFNNRIKHPLIYETVRKTIAYAFVHSEWGARWATGEYLNQYLK